MPQCLKVAVLPGDGIGQEVTEAAIPVFEALNVPVDLQWGDIGWSFWRQEGTPIPARTWSLIKQVDTILLGATTSKPPREAAAELEKKLPQSSIDYISPIIQLRQKLELFANVRPCFAVSEGKEFNFCIIRENTEGLYAGFDYYPIPQVLHHLITAEPTWHSLAKEEISCALRIQTHKGLKRLFEFAFHYAEAHEMRRVTLADKPNVLRQSGAFAREIFEEVAKQYSSIRANILNADATALWLIKRPQEFGVIVAENMFGDILSDVGAGVMGGLGLAPSANIGLKGSYFEPVHGSAPNIPSNSANPCAMFLTISLLLKHFGYLFESNKIKLAVKAVIKEGNTLTYDLGGSSRTHEMAKAIITACQS